MEQLEKENDSYRRTVLELELENEKLQVEYKASTEASNDIIENHRRELEELRNEFTRQRNELCFQVEEEKESVRRLSEECRNHAEKWKDLEMESAEKMEKLRADHDVLLRGEKDRSFGLEKELDGMRCEIERLTEEESLYRCNIAELNRVVEDVKAKLAEVESRKLAECESQTDSMEFSDAESQTGLEAETRDTSSSEISQQTEILLKQDQMTQVEDKILDVDPTEAGPPGGISAELSQDVDVQTDILNFHSVEIQAVSTAEDGEVQVQLNPVLDCTDVVPQPDLLPFMGAFEADIPGFGSCLGPPVPAQGELDCGPPLELRVDDYLPLQRHDEIIAQLKARMEEENTVAIMNVSQLSSHNIM